MVSVCHRAAPDPTCSPPVLFGDLLRGCVHTNHIYSQNVFFGLMVHTVCQLMVTQAECLACVTLRWKPAWTLCALPHCFIMCLDGIWPRLDQVTVATTWTTATVTLVAAVALRVLELHLNVAGVFSPRPMDQSGSSLIQGQLFFSLCSSTLGPCSDCQAKSDF